MDEVKVINRIRALPVKSDINVNKDVCIYRALFVRSINPKDIRYPCFICGPTTKGFSRVSDLVKHSVCSHDLFPSRVQQSHAYICDGMDLVAATPEQLDKFKDGFYRSKKKLEEVEKAEATRILAEARTKAGEKAKRQDGGSTSRKVDVGDMVRRSEVQVEIQKARNAEARKREELLEEERVAAEKKIQAEEQKKVREDRKKKVWEEWQINVRLA